MTIIASGSNNPQGHFSTKAAHKAQRKDAANLFQNIYSVQYENDDANTRQALLNDIYTALESGVAIPKRPQELALLSQETGLEQLETTLNDQRDFPDAANNLESNINKVKALLKKHRSASGDYDLDSLFPEHIKMISSTVEAEQYGMEHFKTAVRGVFTENPQVLFEKGAACPESLKRMVELLDLPAQNDKGWNLTSQAAKAANPKLTNAFERAGFGANMHSKAVVDFAKAMTQGSNAEKSAALKELLGVTPLT